MKFGTVSGTVLGALLMATALSPAKAADMTMDRLLNVQKEPQNWLMVHENYSSHRFSPLTQITADNAPNLKLAFAVGLGGMQSGGKYSFGDLEGTPLVEDGMMYVTDGWGAVYAIDVTNGHKAQIKWKFDPGVDRAWAGDVACCGVDNRGVALWKDKIISIALDGRMFEINKATGEEIWERKIAEPAIGETLTEAPLVIRDTAIVGPAGGENGIRGYMDATDLNTGKQLWRTYTIPGTGEPGNETWKDGKNHWQHGGGSTWETASYDPSLDVFYQGTGNAGPDYDPEYRPGDNKWAASVLAVSPNDGKIQWGFQFTPNDPYDYDEIAENPLVDMKVNGTDRKLMVHAGRNGFFYALDRSNGSFVGGKQYVDKLTWATGLDPKTGKPLEYNPNEDVQTYVPGTHATRANPVGLRCPPNNGGKNWEPTSYDENLGLIYIAGGEGCTEIDLIPQKDFVDQGGTVQPRASFTGGSGKNPTHQYGSLKGVDPATGETKVSLKLDYPNFAGVLTTGSDLVFLGHYDGSFDAYDAKTLKPLWDFNVGTGINAPPISYSVNGKQYIAVLAGSRMATTVISNSPELKNMSPESMLFVFSL